ncbi:MAG: sigma-70 family RNA polymerase sigma factor [Clostridia bacterium]|nr:sigma-70 family RNA polymerase sigma factor [Clostridia bacterium]
MANDAFLALLQGAQSGNADAEQQLVRDNLPLVYAIAKRFRSSPLEEDDVKQLGAIGLLKAIRRFDPAYGVCFSTYAVPLIAGEIKRFLRDDGVIKYSRTVKELLVSIRQLQAQQPDITLDELAAKLAVDAADIEAALASGTQLQSLDEPDRITGEPFGTSLPSDSRENETVNRLWTEAMLHSLDERDRLLMELRYRAEMTQSEVGKRLGISQVQVSRLEKRILLRLRERERP